MKEDTGPVGTLTHVGIDVADLERAEAFYSALLGVRRDSAWEQYLAFEPLPSGLTVYLQRVPGEEDQQDPGTHRPDGARRAGGAGESRSSRRKGAQGLRRARRESGRSRRPRRQRVLPIERVEAAPVKEVSGDNVGWTSLTSRWCSVDAHDGKKEPPNQRPEALGAYRVSSDQTPYIRTSHRKVRIRYAPAHLFGPTHAVVDVMPGDLDPESS